MQYLILQEDNKNTMQGYIIIFFWFNSQDSTTLHSQKQIPVFLNHNYNILYPYYIYMIMMIIIIITIIIFW